jgi:hypothetical protein
MMHSALPKPFSWSLYTRQSSPSTQKSRQNGLLAVTIWVVLSGKRGVPGTPHVGAGGGGLAEVKEGDGRTGDGEGVSIGVGDGEGVSIGVGDGEGVSMGVGIGVGMAVKVEELSELLDEDVEELRVRRIMSQSSTSCSIRKSSL